MRATFKAVFASILFIGLNGCAGNALPGVYRLQIQQGNVITQEMLDQVEIGMDQRRVRFILGTPLITDTFNQNRWDYLYSLKKSNNKKIQRHVSLYFDNDVLIRMEGEVRSGATPEGVRPRTETIVTVPAERKKKGFFAALIPDFLEKKPKKSRVAAAAEVEPPTGATASASTGEPATESADAATATAAVDAEDRAYLDQLFGDYGALESGAIEASQ